MSTAVYAESSAVLAWLLNEPEAGTVRDALRGAGRVVTSRLTLVECARAFGRGRAQGRLDEAGALAAHRLLDEASADWVIMDLAGEVMTRAAQPFPQEPVRTLDAFHLASALVFHRALGELRLLSLDDRLGNNAAALGLATTA